jgi:ubiquinone/menaquinone biosynthesis C-methylase UbiE
MSVSGLGRMVRFNWPDYLLAAGVILVSLVVAIPVSAPFPGLLTVLAIPAAVVAAWFVVASLVAGWWIYDRSRLYDWAWAASLLERSPARWANVTVGFDESSVRLREVLGAGGTTIDVFDAAGMTEASIRRARASRAPIDGTIRCRLDDLPFGDGSLDAAFVIFAAHEVRDPAGREALFDELARVVRRAGAVVLVEHPRSLPNLIVFGPGAGHFLPRAEWRRLASRSGFRLQETRSMTPFVDAMAFERQE